MKKTFLALACVLLAPTLLVVGGGWGKVLSLRDPWSAALKA